MRDVDPALFPNVVSALRRAGIDPERELVPVAPAAHYMMGGIATDLDGRSTLPGLYAVGECSCTGLHGANRLASNSLSECFVFGARAARAAVASDGSPTRDGATSHLAVAPEPTAATRAALWRYAGLERDGDGLRTLAEDPHPLARLIARSALNREESRGAHQRTDFPSTDTDLDQLHVTLAGDGAPDLARWK
jgi:L-aspartate oxidase